MASGPLSGLRVIEMTGDDARLAGKMLTEAGAAVVRLGPAFGGPAMADPAVAARGGLLDWWFDGGKDVVVDDLASEAGQSAYRRLAEHADLVIESSPPGRLAELGLDHDDAGRGQPSARPGLAHPVRPHRTSRPLADE